MRGKVVPHSQFCNVLRITPAYAGKRRPEICQGLCGRDHPCVCGEKWLSMQSSQAKSGSPLRMRGKDMFDIIKKPAKGITPAYAGKRVKNVAIKKLPRDHPCVCGEK